MIDKHQPKSPSSVAKSTLPHRELTSLPQLPVDNMVLPLTLKPEIASLRDIALKGQQLGISGIPTLPLIDAQSWSERADDEDWPDLASPANESKT